MVAVKGGVAAWAQLQQPVQGGRLHAGQLRQPLGGPAGRRGQDNLGPLGAGQGNDGAHRVALTAAGPAGQHRHPLGQRQPDRRLLLWCQGDAEGLAQPVQRDRPVHRLRPGQPVAGRAQQAQQPAGQGDLGTMERHQPDRPARASRGIRRHIGGERLGNHALLSHQLLNTAAGKPGLHAQQPRRLANQLGLRQIAVAVVAGLRQGELQAGLDPLRAVMGNAQAPGDLIGGLEPDPPHLAGQPVRLSPDHLDRLILVGLVDPHRQRGRHPHPLEEDHHLLDGLLLFPGGGDHAGAFGTQASHLDQPPWGLLDHLQGGLAEVLHDPLGHPGTDPLDQP